MSKPRTLRELQDDFLSWRFGMFIHFGIATYNDVEWAVGYEDPDAFAPDALDCGQWADTAVAAGMRYVVFTTKHTDGRAHWPSVYTSHDTEGLRNLRHGQADLVAEFVAAMRARHLKVGLYYCFPGDYGSPTVCTGVPIPDGKPDLHGLPPEAAGDFVGFIKNQLTELLTGYGPIDLLWIDQYNNRYTKEAWPEFQRHVKALQPECLLIANNSHDPTETDILGFEYPWLANQTKENPLPGEANAGAAEVCDTLGPTWFWNSQEDAGNLKSAERILEMLKTCNARRANYLLNVGPDRSGLIPAYSVERLQEIGTLLRAQV